MIGIDFTQFDQSAALLTAFCVLALIRERRILPFVASAIGAFFQGLWIPSLIAALIAWHRMDRGCTRWIQIKDFAGVFFILAGTVATDPLRPFFVFFGVFFMSINFGGGVLGTLPALLLLRQFHPQPEFIEVALVGYALYWIFAEAARWTEIKHERLVLSWAEVVGGSMVLLSFKEDIEKWISDPILGVIAGLLLAIVFTLFIWIYFREEGFSRVYQDARSRLLSIMLWGGRWISGEEPWARSEPEGAVLEFEVGLNGVFWWVLGVVTFVVAMIFFSKGGWL